MRKTQILLMGLLVSIMVLFTGCGAKKIDVMESLTLSYSGVNGYGTAELENAYGWEAAAFEAANIKEIENFSDLGDAFTIESAVSYNISPKDNLSNGDEIIVTAQINNAAVEEFKIKFEAAEKKFIVSGLPEVQTIDLFENIDVSYTEIAPNAKASIVDANTDYYVITRYKLDKDSGLDIGDVVTVIAEYDKDQLLKAGYIAESDTKEFTVSDISRYAAKLSDIPEDAFGKMQKQTEDIIKSNVAKYKGYSLENMNLLGNYFLTAKSYDGWGEHNCIYYVYQVDMAKDETVTYYYYVGYNDILLTEDNTCVYDFNNKKEPWNICDTLGLGTLSWQSLNGYYDIDELFNECVTKNLDRYDYESSITQTE